MYYINQKTVCVVLLMWLGRIIIYHWFNLNYLVLQKSKQLFLVILLNSRQLSNSSAVEALAGTRQRPKHRLPLWFLCSGHYTDNNTDVFKLYVCMSMFPSASVTVLTKPVTFYSLPCLAHLTAAASLFLSQYCLQLDIVVTVPCHSGLKLLDFSFSDMSRLKWPLFVFLLSV